MPQAGFSTDIQIAGTSTAVTGLTLGSVGGQVYGPNEVYRVFDPGASMTVYDNGSPVSASDISDVNHLFGLVTFDGSYTVTGPVTADFNYFPMQEFANLVAIDWTAKRQKLLSTVFVPGATSASEKSFAGVKSFTASGTVIESLQTDLDTGAGAVTLADLLANGTPFVFEDADAALRSWCRIEGTVENSSVDGRVEGQFNLVGVVKKDITFGYDASYSYAP